VFTPIDKPASCAIIGACKPWYSKNLKTKVLTAPSARGAGQNEYLSIQFFLQTLVFKFVR